MQNLDLANAAVNGLSISPTANVSADQTGLGVDLGPGSLVGHAILAVEGLSGTLLVHIQESADNSAGSYTDSLVYSVGLPVGTGTVPNGVFMLQFTRNNRYGRVKVVANGVTNFRVSAILTSMRSQGVGGGVDLSPAG